MERFRLFARGASLPGMAVVASEEERTDATVASTEEARTDATAEAAKSPTRLREQVQGVRDEASAAAVAPAKLREQVAGARTEGEEDIIRAPEARAAEQAWDVQKVDAAMVAAAMSLVHDKRSHFLGAEVKERTSTEDLFISAWQALNRGDIDAAIGCADQLLALDSTNEKAYYTRAVGYARSAKWRYALADYSSYLQLLEQTSGPNLANALYGRALCLTKLGKRALALKDLDECIRVGPEDEQVTETDASLVPVAIVARFALLHACPELRRARDVAAASTAAAVAATPGSSAAAATAAAAATPTTDESSSYEGAVWSVLATDLEVAVERAVASGLTPLLLDNTADKAVDAYYLYAPATILEAKRMVLEVRSAGVPIADARESMRRQLVRAMRYGHTLVIRLANSAADFVDSYCADDAFPLAVFDQTLWPCDKALDLYPRSSSPFARALRAEDVAGS